MDAHLNNRSCIDKYICATTGHPIKDYCEKGCTIDRLHQVGNLNSLIKRKLVVDGLDETGNGGTETSKDRGK